MRLKQLTAVMLSMVMMAGMVPVTALAAEESEASKDRYVLMNIPYDKFYEAELAGYNTESVDGVTSATKNKTRGSLVAGSYHVDAEGSDISGITFPVKISAEDYAELKSNTSLEETEYKQITDESSVSIEVTNRGQTSTTIYSGQEALFESASYSWYDLGENTPQYYKNVTVENGEFSFGEAVYEETKTEEIDISAAEGNVSNNADSVDNTYTFTTNSSYGDYQLNLTINNELFSQATKVYAVIVNTDDGKYGLRHLENIWQMTKLSWSTGIVTEEHHGCSLSYAHYASMMGENIQSVVYYTDNGKYTFNIQEENGIYVAKKFANMTVADVAVTAGETEISWTDADGNKTKIPEDYDASYDVEGLEGVSVEGNVLRYNTAGVLPGEYTLTMTDISGIYAPLSASFLLTTDEVAPVTFDASRNALVAKDGYTAGFQNFISGITSVSVNGTSYAASGRGSVKLVNADGTLVTDAAPIAAQGTYELEVYSKGYNNPITFTYTVEAQTENPSDDSTAGGSTGTGNNAGTNTGSVSTGGTGNGNTTQNTTNNTTATETVTLAKVKRLKKQKVKARAVTLKWKKVSNADGYEIVRSNKKKSGYKVVKTVNKAGKVKFTNKKLARKKTYYYKVRAYKMVNGVKVYGDYSKVLKVRTK